MRPCNAPHMLWEMVFVSRSLLSLLQTTKGQHQADSHWQMVCAASVPLADALFWQMAA